MRNQKAVSISALLLLAATVAAASPERHVRQSLNLDPNGRFSLNTHNGTITVTAWNRPTVDVDARIEPADADYAEDVNKVDIRITGGGGSVRVETNYDRIGWRTSSWFFGSNNSRSLPPVHYTISLPAGATVEIEDHNASVRVTGIQGDVRVDSHNGRIDLNGIGGAADVTSHNGEVRIGFSRFTKASEIETHNGSIDVQMPPDARFNLNAHGHHLSFDSDFPVTSKELSRDTYAGNVNGGGPALRIGTHNGSVRLRR